MAATSIQSNLSELDAMLQDLSNSKYAKSTSSAGYNDYSDYYVDDRSSVAASANPAPMRPPPPKSYTPDSKKKSAESQDYYAESQSSTMKLPKALKPPKLQHVLTNRRQHDLVKAIPRHDEAMKAPDFPNETDDYGGSNYSTLKPPESIIPELSDDELDEIDAGETPREEKSMIIKTDHGTLKSKYRYLGFGLWENTEPPDPKPPPKKPSPPPPPPKAEPIWYNCSVEVKTHKTSKELDDLFHDLDGYERMARKDVELGNAAADLPASLGDNYERFEKEDMSDMFKRAFLEKMALKEPMNIPTYKCHVCRQPASGRVITAMTKKFHPKCFVCTYCQQPFKERRFKSDADYKPYCFECFEKLLGHFGSAHFKLNQLI